MDAVSGKNPTEIRKRSRILDAEVGHSIRVHRKNAKMTLQELAERLGIAYQQVQKYETGVNRIGAGRLIEIAEILHVPAARFFEGDRGSPIAGSGTDTESALQSRQLLRWFLNIKNPNERRKALDYVHALAEPESA